MVEIFAMGLGKMCQTNNEQSISLKHDFMVQFLTIDAHVMQSWFVYIQEKCTVYHTCYSFLHRLVEATYQSIWNPF